MKTIIAEKPSVAREIARIAVSYTHLDVYKRQTGDCAGTAGYFPFRIITRALPVSVPSPSVAASPSISRGIRAATRCV